MVFLTRAADDSCVTSYELPPTDRVGLEDVLTIKFAKFGCLVADGDTKVDDERNLDGCGCHFEEVGSEKLDEGSAPYLGCCGL